MNKGNELKMKEILDELEDTIEEESILENEVEENEYIDDEIIIDSDEEVLEESILEDEIEENEIIEEEIIIDSDEEVLEESVLEGEVEENETNEEEEIQEDELEDDKEYVIKETVIDTDIKKIGDYIIEILLKYKYVLLLDFSVFLLLFFLIPTIILEVKPYIWMSLFLIFTILPTMAFYIKNKFKEKQIMIGFLFFFICILCILDLCTITDLYGITSHGTLDKTPAWIDSLLVTFIIVFFQYLGILIVNVMKSLRKKKI